MITLVFDGKKTIKTGGVSILINEVELGRCAKNLICLAKLPHLWEFVHNGVGYSYQLPNMNAVLDCAQLEQPPGFLIEKRCLFDSYKLSFADLFGVSLLAELVGYSCNYLLHSFMMLIAHRPVRCSAERY